MRRFIRLTNAFSKKLEPHMHMFSLYTVRYNFVRMHKTLKCSPAMEAGLTSKLWEMEDLVALIDAHTWAPKKRGTYRPRQPKTV